MSLIQTGDEAAQPMMIRRKAFIAIALITLVAIWTIQGFTQEKSPQFEFHEPPPMRENVDYTNITLEYMNQSNNPLDGCYHVYLDVGTNVGIQVKYVIFFLVVILVLSLTPNLKTDLCLNEQQR